MKKYLFLLVVLVFVQYAEAQKRNTDVYKYPEYAVSKIRNDIDFPDINGWQTLKAELHIHTVFSDGLVWPTIRVEEVWNEGLDVLAITDHLEYTPHEKLVDKNANNAYEIAKPTADRLGILLIRGAEITRNKPDGHLNALFISDGEKLRNEKVTDVLKEVRKQGGFVMWNHPGWPNDTSTFFEQNREWIAEGLIQGIEVYNQYEYYPKTLTWCLENNLSMLGNTDMHEVSSYPFQKDQNEIVFRPMNLVFVKERTLEGVKEAMFARRTVVYFNNKIVGEAKLLKDFFQASYVVRPIPWASNDREDAYHIQNMTDMPYELMVDGRSWVLPAKSTVVHRVKKGIRKQECEVKNLIVGEFKYLQTEIVLMK